MNKQKLNIVNEKNLKDETLTFIQVICSYAVISLHTNGKFWTFSATERYWMTANIIECIFYFAVPIFFMITGITLIDYQDKYSLKEYFKKRILKTVFPYIAWSFIGIAYLYISGQIELITLRYIINGLLTGNIISVYWFFPVLFCVYLSLPFFAAIDKSKRKWVFEYLFVVAFFVNILIPFIINIIGINIHWPYSLEVVSGYLIWIVTGVLLYKYPLKKNIKYIIICFGILGLFMHIIGTYRLSMAAGSIVQTYKGYNNLPCFFYVLGIFIILTEMAKKIMKIKILRKVINFLGNYTFSFYLMHWYIMDILKNMLNVDTRAIVWRLGAPVIIEIIVIIITYITRQFYRKIY